MSDDMVRAAAPQVMRQTPPGTDTWIRIALLQAELSHDLRFVTINYRKNREMTRRLECTPDPTEFEYAALGYTLHNLYSAIESYFLRIAKFFENNLEETAWHRSLVERMTLEIQGVRAAFLTQDDRMVIEELMRFRHLFRNLYKTPLVPEKLLYANRQAVGVDERMAERHTTFNQFLISLAREVSDD